MLHELRIYHCAPGKLGEVNKRFATATLALFTKHGIKQVGFWPRCRKGGVVAA